MRTSPTFTDDTWYDPPTDPHIPAQPPPPPNITYLVALDTGGERYQQVEITTTSIEMLVLEAEFFWGGKVVMFAEKKFTKAQVRAEIYQAVLLSSD